MRGAAVVLAVAAAVALLAIGWGDLMRPRTAVEREADALELAERACDVRLRSNHPDLVRTGPWRIVDAVPGHGARARASTAPAAAGERNGITGTLQCFIPADGGRPTLTVVTQ